MKLPYSEGTIFAVPLRNGGFATGLVARSTDDGKIILTYLFGPKLLEQPLIENLQQLSPSKALRALRVGDLSLIDGGWRILGRLNRWSRDEWPMPSYVRRDHLSKKAWKVVYSDLDPNRLMQEEPFPYDDTSLERDAVLGSGAVELILTKLLD